MSSEKKVALARLTDEIRRVVQNHEEGFSCDDGHAGDLKELLEVFEATD